MTRAWRWLLVLASAWLVLVSSSCSAPAAGVYREKGWQLELRGAASVTEREARDAIDEDLERFEPAEPSRIALENAAWSLERLYRRVGFPDARVEATLDTASDGTPLARLQVEEGKRVVLEGIRFSGNRAISDSVLERLIEPPDGGLFGDATPWYVASKVSDLASSVADLYRARGYLDVVVSKPELTFDADKTSVRVELRIEDGRRYRLRSVKLQGELAGFDAELAKQATREQGEPYSPAFPAAIRGRCEDLLGHHGYADARVTLAAEQRGADGEVDLVFDVDAGVAVRIAGIAYEGNDRTARALIDEALGIEAGARYDVEEVREAARRLQGLELFSSVRLEFEGEGEARELVVAVQELPRRELYVEPGYGSYEEFRLLAGWRERNLLGSGRQAELDGTLGAFAQKLRVGIADPRFVGDIRADASLFVNRREEPSFTKNEVGGAFTLLARPKREWQGRAVYSLRHSSLSDADTSDPDVQEALESVDISSIELGTTYDTRDDVFVPHKGFLGRASVEYGSALLGSELDFVRFKLLTAGFVRLWRGAVLGASAQGGIIAPLDDTGTIPLQERLFNGGENTVRSFRENELGPKSVDTGEPLGGEAYSVFSVELRQRVVGELEAALFADAGNVLADYTDYFSFDDMEYAIGGGLRYLLPIGPVRVDVGFNPWHDDGEDSYVVHVSLGMAF